MDWQALWQNLLELLTSVGLKLLYAVLILIIGLKLTSFITKRARKSKWYQKTDQSVAHFLVNSMNVILKVLVFISAALVIGIPATSFVAILTSAGVAIGLALQGSLSNFVGGIMILLFKPFRVGDYIESPDCSGTVQDITIFYTVLTTPDNKVVHCPNGSLSNSNVINYSEMDKRRVDLTASVSYTADIEIVKKLLLDTVTAHEKVLSDTPPTIRLSKCGDSSLDFVVRVWCKTSDYWDVYFDLTEAVKNALDQAGVEIPYPQLDVHIRDTSEQAE